MTQTITHDALLNPSITHGFFTREGGVSEGIFSSLNVGIGSTDNKAHVMENRARCARAFGVNPEALTTLHQVHSATVVTLDAPYPLAERPEADAMVTSARGLMLGILTADCAPVLFADTEAGVIGAAHAGWKGAAYGVLEATIAAMEALGATRARTAAVIGPCIAQTSYEVGEEFYTRIVDLEAEHARYFSRGNEGHWQFNLPAFVKARLVGAGLHEVHDVAMDTRVDAQRFFSYRRKTLSGEADYGRQLSAIMLAT